MPERWSVEYLPRALRALNRMDAAPRERVLRAMRDLAGLERPEGRCKRLTGNMAGFWRLRVGDWRVVLLIDRGEVLIVAVDLGHRGRVYDA
jgi:mRNA interferase RelE/StbE